MAQLSRHASLENLRTSTTPLDEEFQVGERILEPLRVDATTTLNSYRLLPKVKQPQRVTLEGLLGGPGTLASKGNSHFMRRNYWKVGNEVAPEELVIQVADRSR